MFRDHKLGPSAIWRRTIMPLIQSAGTKNRRKVRRYSICMTRFRLLYGPWTYSAHTPVHK